MPRRHMNLAAFFVSSALNCLAVLGCVVAIMDPLPALIELDPQPSTDRPSTDRSEPFHA